MKETEFVFRIFHPKGALSPFVQAVWSASVPSVTARGSGSVIRRQLNTDACSGILFNLGAPIMLGDEQFKAGVMVQPVSKRTHSISFQPGSRLVGVRFHPGVGFGVLGAHYEKPTVLADDAYAPKLALHDLFRQLEQAQSQYGQIITAYQWLQHSIDFTGMVPHTLSQALNATQQQRELAESVPLSQRQIERQFQRWLGMTPKYYQRILRVRKTLSAMRSNPSVNLVQLALEYGYSDQAHMTRELQAIANITPHQYRKIVG